MKIPKCMKITPAKTLIFLSIACFLFIVRSNGNSIISNLSIGFIVSTIFYFIVVWLPERNQRKLIKRSMEEQYLSFKDEFKKYFSKPANASQGRWHAVANGLESNNLLLKDLSIELEIFKDEINFVLNSVKINDKKVFDLFKRLSQHIYRLKNPTPGTDDLKSLMRFLWELFSGWSWDEGYRKEDIVKIMIQEI
ncbi:MAG: hypothetical protein ACNS63_01190 [Candidatus Nitrospinota bacterium M3_3B_026]